MGREEELRQIAHHLWEEEGYPEGRDLEHWFRAEAIWGQRQQEQTAAPKAKQNPRSRSKVMAARKKSSRV
jgi:hypothetical protein